MNSKSVFIIFSFVCLTFFLIGFILTIYSISNEKNDCRMTFMFEYPNFVVSEEFNEVFIECGFVGTHGEHSHINNFLFKSID